MTIRPSPRPLCCAKKEIVTCQLQWGLTGDCIKGIKKNWERFVTWIILAGVIVRDDGESESGDADEHAQDLSPVIPCFEEDERDNHAYGDGPGVKKHACKEVGILISLCEIGGQIEIGTLIISRKVI
jgi:hypothetical protein